MTIAQQTSEKIKVAINVNLKSLKVVERPLKQNSFKLSFESRGVRDFSNVTDIVDVLDIEGGRGTRASVAHSWRCHWSLCLYVRLSVCLCLSLSDRQQLAN